MTAGASKAEPTITRQPALAPSPQPRPAPTARSLPPKHAATGGQNWTPIRGQIWKLIDRRKQTWQSHLPQSLVQGLGQVRIEPSPGRAPWVAVMRDHGRIGKACWA